MSGFIAMQREALEHPLFRGNPERFYAWFWLVARAAWKPTPYDINGKVVTIERGQLCASRSQLADAWKWSPSAVERFLTRLETEQMIGRATGQGRTIITICNYSKYQDASSETGQAAEQQTGQRPDSDRTTKEPLNHLTKEKEAKASSSKARAKAKFILPDWVPVEPWDEYIAMRAGIKKPLTDYGKGLAVAELAKLADDGHPPGPVLNQSIFKKYLGLFPIKDQQHAQPTHSRNSGASSLDAMQQAIQLTGGPTRGSTDGPHSSDRGADALPYAVRSLGYDHD